MKKVMKKNRETEWEWKDEEEIKWKNNKWKSKTVMTMNLVSIENWGWKIKQNLNEKIEETAKNN